MLTQPDIAFPIAEPPEPGDAIEVAPGLLWARFRLPFKLDHVNVYLVEDGPGFAAIDTGLGTDETKEAWERLLAGPLGGRPLTRVVATHFHPDHVGLAGWLTERFAAPLSMSRTEFLFTLAIRNKNFAANPHFYTERGLTPEQAGTVAGTGHGYLLLTTGLPTEFHRLVAGETLRLGRRRFEIRTGGGHAPEQVMLYDRDARILLAADQVLPRITPNIGVPSMEPGADALGEFLASLAALRRDTPADALVLPGHHMPFTGLHARLDELADHHEARCALIAAACRAAPKLPAELLPVLFRRDLDPHQTGFAFGEVVAHVNHMVAKGRLRPERGADGSRRYAAT